MPFFFTFFLHFRLSLSFCYQHTSVDLELGGKVHEDMAASLGSDIVKKDREALIFYLVAQLNDSVFKKVIKDLMVRMIRMETAKHVIRAIRISEMRGNNLAHQMIARVDGYSSEYTAMDLIQQAVEVATTQHVHAVAETEVRRKGMASDDPSLVNAMNLFLKESGRQKEVTAPYSEYELSPLPTHEKITGSRLLRRKK